MHQNIYTRVATYALIAVGKSKETYLLNWEGDETVKKICKTCVLEDGSKCKILHEKITQNCYAWADEVEVERREKEIQEYEKRFDEMIFPVKTVKEKLEEKFLELYKNGYNDKKIADILKISPSSVGQYRNKLGLEKNKYIRPAATGTDK